MARPGEVRRRAGGILVGLLGLMLLLGAIAPARAYPSLFVNEVLNGPADCLVHPTKGFGGHGPPGPDALSFWFFVFRLARRSLAAAATPIATSLS